MRVKTMILIASPNVYCINFSIGIVIAIIRHGWLAGLQGFGLLASTLVYGCLVFAVVGYLNHLEMMENKNDNIESQMD